uniref:Amino acid permease/ SLC12A domain-containing protein n=2 Tax=Salix viminalis TaxID=40686 RepID=A0A6N2KAS9_SALVM
MKMFHHELFHSNNPQVLFMDVYEKTFPIRTSWSSFIASVFGNETKSKILEKVHGKKLLTKAFLIEDVLLIGIVLALFFGGQDSLPFFLARQHIPGLDVVVDPCAAVLVLVVTGLLCMGIKEVLPLWGVNGMLAGSATVFFAYIGFDSVASTAEEVKNPQRDLPLGIGLDCCCLYMMVSVVIVGLVPYYAMDPDTPISSAFAAYGMQWAAYLIAAGAVMALCSTLMGSILPQEMPLKALPCDTTKKQKRILSHINCLNLKFCSIGIFMDVSELAGMVSVARSGIHYVPPDEVPFPSSLQEIIDSVSLRYSTGCQNVTKEKSGFYAGTSTESNLPLLGEATAIEYPIIVKLQLKQLCFQNSDWPPEPNLLRNFDFRQMAYGASDLSIPRNSPWLTFSLPLNSYALRLQSCLHIPNDASGSYALGTPFSEGSMDSLGVVEIESA